MAPLHHLGIDAEEVSTCVALVGPGLHLDDVVTSLGPADALGAHREFRTVRVERRGQPVIVTSIGWGGPSLAIAIEELARSGAEVVVLVDRPDPGVEVDVIVIGAVRDEGTSRQYAPLDYPAAPDPALLLALCARLPDLDIGLLQTVDVDVPDHPTGVVGRDLHAASLFVVSAACGVAAGSIAMGTGDHGHRIVAAAIDAMLDCRRGMGARDE